MSTVRGGNVQQNVQDFADAVNAATGVSSFGTYPGHEPSEDLAVDCFTPVDERALGDAICGFALNNLDRFGILYVIYRRMIYNLSIAPYWRPMSDRGSPTANHEDHVHVSFVAMSSPPPSSNGVPPFPGQTQMGSSGNAVRQVQQRFSDRGWNIRIDGDFGPQTNGVVRAFQAEKGLTVDGIVGPITWATMWNAPVT